MKLKNIFTGVKNAGKSILNKCKKYPTASFAVAGTLGVGFALTASLMIAVSSLSNAVSDIGDQLSSLDKTGQALAGAMEVFDKEYQDELAILNLEKEMAADYAATLSVEEPVAVESIAAAEPVEESPVLDYYASGGYDHDVQVEIKDYLANVSASNVLPQEFRELTPKNADQTALFVGNINVVANNQYYLDKLADLPRSDRESVTKKFAHFTTNYAKNSVSRFLAYDQAELQSTFKNLGKASDTFCHALFPQLDGDKKWCVKLSVRGYIAYTDYAAPQ